MSRGWTVTASPLPLNTRSLVYPIYANGRVLSGKTVFNIVLYDADLLAGVFMGQLNLQLESLLGAINTLNQPVQQW